MTDGAQGPPLVDVADGDEEADGPRLAEGEVEGLAEVAVAEGLGEDDGAAEPPEDPLGRRNHHSRKRTTSTASTSSARRRQ
jgi:hypothetical protein